MRSPTPFPTRPVRHAILACGLGWLTVWPATLGAIDPAAAEDAAIERQKILKAADQLELLIQQNEQLRLQVQELRTEVERLRAEQGEFKKQAAAQDKARAAEKDALLREISEIVAAGKSAPASKPTPSPSSPSAPSTSSGEGFEHIVQPGQSLWAIAKAFQDQGIRVTAEDIRLANHLKDNTLRTGQKLFIPKK